MKQIIFFSLLILSSCSSSWKQLSYKSMNWNLQFTITVPKGGKLQRNPRVLRPDQDTEYRIVYPDSSVIYITDNYIQGSLLNMANHGRRDILGDTTVLSGLQSDGVVLSEKKYWKEITLTKETIVIGYVNVPVDKKELYDRALATLQRRKK